jgi:hypothetical protein|nr:type IV toxin-antitoxin system AbiEi family antitoxin domain-containing protein [Neorhizobium tomejilense]
MNDAMDGYHKYLRDAFSLLSAARRPLAMNEIADMGINRTTLSQLVETGWVERPVRGVYHVPSEADDARVFWAALSLGYDTVFCLTSAAAYHGLTEEAAGIPDVAIPLRAREPSRASLDIKVRFHRWPDAARTADVATEVIQGVPVRITTPERTVVDMFRHSELNDETVFVPIIQDTAFVDCLSRYLETGDQNQKSQDLRRVASDHGCWEAIQRYSSVVLMTRERMTPR